MIEIPTPWSREWIIGDVLSEIVLVENSNSKVFPVIVGSVSNGLWFISMLAPLTRESEPFFQPEDEKLTLWNAVVIPL